MDRKKTLNLIVILALAIVVAIGVYLRLARNPEPNLTDLPDRILAQGDNLKVTQSELDSYLAGLDKERREVESQDPEGVLENLIKNRLFLGEAKKLPKDALPDTAGMSPAEAGEALIGALRNHVTKDVKAPEENIRAYYEQHKSEYEGQQGSSYEEMRGAIADYLRYDLVYKAFESYTNSLVAKSNVKKNREWVNQIRAKITDPLAKARTSGKPIIADFGRGI